MEEVTTLFDSDEAEYEYMKEREEKEKQIEEMQADLMLAIVWSDGGGVKCGDTAKNLYDADYRKRREVAAEIFAEIEKIGVVTQVVKAGKIIYDVTAEYDELKKKYTEGQTNG